MLRCRRGTVTNSESCMAPDLRRSTACRAASGARRSMQSDIALAVGAVLLFEHVGDVRMAERRAGGVCEQVLLGHIGDVLGLVVLGEQVVERLVLGRADLGGVRLP